MIDRHSWRGILATAVMAFLLAPATSLAFSQSTETSGEIPTNLNGAWLVVNRLEFPRPSVAPTPAASPGETATSPAPKAATSAAAGSGAVRPFTVANIFTIRHIPTAEAQKLRDAQKEKRQASMDKAKKILAEEQKEAAKAPQPAASGDTLVEPKVLGFGIPRAPDSVVDLYDEVDVTLHDVEIPKEVQDSIDKANQAEKRWEPSAKELALLKSSWSTLKPKTKSEYARIQWKVLQDKYLEGGMKQDDKTRDAKFVISGDQSLIASPGQANRNIVIYGADKIGNGVIEGGHVRAIMTAAPFPIPIDMKGTFKMFKLADLPKPAAKKGK